MTLNGLGVEFLETGSGPDLLFLHPQDGADPGGRYLELLKRKFRVTLPSHPGFGKTDLPRSFSTVDDLSYFYLDFMKSRRMRDVILVGVSFGAWLALEIASKHPAEVSRLVLASPLGIKLSDREDSDFVDVFKEALMDWIPVWSNGAGGGCDLDGLTEELALRIARNRETFTLMGWAPYLFNPKLPQRLKSLDLPTLVLGAAEDRLYRGPYAQALAATLKGAQFKSIPGAGHYLHADQPEAFAQAVLEFAGQPQPA